MTARWFGDYEIVKRLRAGGMATLYLARRHGAAGFSRLVALKMVHPSLVAQPGFIEMFVDEARICSQISHPNIVHVEEFGAIDGVHYLVMEYLDGCSISELLQVFRHDRRKLDPELVARVIAQIAGGLHTAHETCDQDGKPLDIIHRDISPSNVLLTADGNAKLIDFGIAKARNRRAETQSGVSLKGKYRYVAPEQATCTAVDRRCDVFSLGVVFWEMLVGEPLFPEDSAIALFARLHQTDVPPPSAVNHAVPTTFDPIVLAMLQHHPDRRPRTAAEVQRQIVLVAPGAANRDPSDLAALAVEVRDRRARWVALRNSGASADQDTPPSFSSAPRSTRTCAEQHEAVVASPSPVHGPVAPAPVSPRPSRRRVRIVLGGLLVLGVSGGAVLGRYSGLQDDRATATYGQSRSKPGGPEHLKPIEPAGIDPPPHNAPSVLPSYAESPPRGTAPSTSGAPASRSPRFAVPASAPSRHDGGRSQKPPSNRGDEGSSSSAPAIIRDFDNNETIAPGELGAVRGKRPPIAPRFDLRTSEAEP